LRAVIEAAIAAGATHVSPILLHLRPHVKDVYMKWLGETYPDQVVRYQDMYRTGAYASVAARSELSEKVNDVMSSLPDRALPTGRNRKKPAAQPKETLLLKREQLTLL
jgi:DNA repair photolyase